MIIYTSQKEVDVYFNSERINQSLLKDILKRGAKALTPKQMKESKAFKFGNLVDFALTSGRNIREEYLIRDNIDLSPSELKIFNNLAERNIKPDRVGEKTLLKAMDIVGYQKNWGNSTRIKKVMPVIKKKYKDFFESFDKKIISEEEFEHLTNTLTELSKIPALEKVFNPVEDKNIQHFFQLPLYFTLDDIQMKALLDKLELHFDEEGRITQAVIIDLKTMEGQVENFYVNVKKFRYDFQLAFYGLAVKDLLKKANLAPNFKIKYAFVVVSSSTPGNAVFYTVPDEIIENAFNGKDRENKKRLEGIKDAISLYKYYKENSKIRVSREIKENDYKIDLTIYDN